jgi:hypothetical protein
MDKKKAPAGSTGGGFDVLSRSLKRRRKIAYFNEVLIELNVPLSVVPMLFTTVMIASEIPAAIRPYSIAVAPDSSHKKFMTMRFKPASLGFVEKAQRRISTGKSSKVCLNRSVSSLTTIVAFMSGMADTRRMVPGADNACFRGFIVVRSVPCHRLRATFY